MNQKELQQKRADIEEAFNEKKAARENVLIQAASLLEEMNRLQGAYQVINELMETAPTVKVKGEK